MALGLEGGGRERVREDRKEERGLDDREKLRVGQMIKESTLPLTWTALLQGVSSPKARLTTRSKNSQRRRTRSGRSKRRANQTKTMPSRAFNLVPLRGKIKLEDAKAPRHGDEAKRKKKTKIGSLKRKT